MHDSNKTATFSYIGNALNQFNLAYLHIIEPRIQGNATITDDGTGLGARFFRSIFKGSMITAGGYDCESGEAILQNGDADESSLRSSFSCEP